MARDPTPSDTLTLYKLQQPVKLDKVLQETQQYEDCLACRLTGAAAFFALGGYSYYSGQHQLQLQREAILKSGSRFGMKSRQTGITGIAMSLVGLGVWRLLN